GKQVLPRRLPLCCVCSCGVHDESGDRSERIMPHFSYMRKALLLLILALIGLFAYTTLLHISRARDLRREAVVVQSSQWSLRHSQPRAPETLTGISARVPFFFCSRTEGTSHGRGRQTQPRRQGDEHGIRPPGDCGPEGAGARAEGARTLLVRAPHR